MQVELLIVSAVTASAKTITLTGSGDSYTDAEMIEAFITSIEENQRFAG